MRSVFGNDFTKQGESEIMEQEIDNMIAIALKLKPKEESMKIVKGLIKVKEADNRLLRVLNDIREKIDNEFRKP